MKKNLRRNGNAAKLSQDEFLFETGEHHSGGHERPFHLPISPPKIVRYFDEYTEETFSLSYHESVWNITANGRKVKLDFSRIDFNLVDVIKWYLIEQLHLNAVTASGYGWIIIASWPVQRELIYTAMQSPEAGIRYLRTDFFSSSRKVPVAEYFTCGKSILKFFCNNGLFGWSLGHINVINCTRSPTKKVGYLSVMDGSSIMSLNEEKLIVEYFYELSHEIQGVNKFISEEDIRNSCILFWNFAHGIRPIQIANRNTSHLKIRSYETSESTVHLTFRYAKQRGTSKSREQTRKMKRDWSIIMVEWARRRDKAQLTMPFDRENSLFGVSPDDITTIVCNLTSKITGVRRTPYELRHSAAQRKADAGCSRLELAEFLMHTDIQTSKAYIRMSPNQAEIINKALGASPLFQAIDQSVKSQSVNIEQLLALPADKQIGAAPHGHLIAGIGGCAIGQSLCTKTPALACYECPKFMYLSDVEIHRSARESVQSIIGEFIEANPVGQASPAFIQLRRVIDTIDGIIVELSEASRQEASE